MGQVLNNVVSETAAGAASGFVSGVVVQTLGSNGVVPAGAAAGATGYLVNGLGSQTLDSVGIGQGKNINSQGLAKNVVTGAVAAGVLTKVNNTISIPGFNSGRNSLEAISKTMSTMYKNGNTSSIYYNSPANQAKQIMYQSTNEAAQQVVGGIVSGFSRLFSNKNK